MTHRYVIYALHNNDSLSVYIGLSSSGLDRPRSHGCPSVLKKYKRLPLYRWISKYRDVGVNYKITVLEVCGDVQQLSETEQFYIAYFKSIGMQLLNLADGGRNGQHSLTSRFRMSQSAKNRSPVHRQRLSEAAKAQVRDEEMRAAIAKSLLGRKRSPEECLAISRGMMGKPHPHSAVDAETRVKISRSLSGIKRSMETRRRMSIAAQAREREKRKRQCA